MVVCNHYIYSSRLIGLHRNTKSKLSETEHFAYSEEFYRFISHTNHNNSVSLLKITDSARRKIIKYHLTPLKTRILGIQMQMWKLPNQLPVPSIHW